MRSARGRLLQSNCKAWVPLAVSQNSFRVVGTVGCLHSPSDFEGIHNRPLKVAVKHSVLLSGVIVNI